MKRNISIYLDLLRLAAAFGVFIGHARHILLPSIPVLVGGHASQSVSVFFVLSGLVIAFVVDTKEKNWKSYAYARAVRMYSVTLIALVVTLGLDALGQAFSLVPYTANSAVRVAFDLGDILTYLTFTNELWWSNRWVGSNQAFWSLGYEVPFYFLFGLYTFVPSRFRWPILGLVGLFIGPKVIAYAPLWLLGVYTYRNIIGRDQLSLKPRVGQVLFFGSFTLYIALRFAIRFPIYNIYESKSLGLYIASWAHFHAVGLCIVANIAGFVAMVGERAVWSRRVEAAIRWLAGGSFTLYLLHQPAMFFVTALFPSVKSSAPLGILAIASVVAFTYTIAEFGERRKYWLPKAIAYFPLGASLMSRR